MKHFKFILVTVTSFLFFFSQSALAAYGADDVADDDSEKTTSYGTEVEVNEFVLLDAMPDIELYYYPYSATDADEANTEDVPGGAGSVFVGGGVIKWHANVATTISIDDFTLTNIDTGVTERNDVAASGLGIAIGGMAASDAAGVAALTFDYTRGAAVANMSADMATAYANRVNDYSSADMGATSGYTDFAAKFYIAVTLANAGSVQGGGIYRASATVRALPTVSS
jgi:hypothetical protein